MKHILAPILLLVFLFPTLALSEEVTLDDLVERKGLYYKKFTDVPFSGKVTGREQGIFKNYLMSRETALHLDKQSNGTALATSWNRIPMVRITNLCLMPGKHTKEQLISETDDGLYLETFKGADIDDKRLTFSFAAERGWKIRNGKIVGLVKNPVIYGETPTFWRNCTGVAGIDQSRIGGIFYCGKTY